MEPKLQKRVGGHCITDRLLGEGAFSKVFLAYGRQGEKQAVKVIPRQEIREKDMARFES